MVAFWDVTWNSGAIFSFFLGKFYYAAGSLYYSDGLTVAFWGALPFFWDINLVLSTFFLINFV